MSEAIDNYFIAFKFESYEKLCLFFQTNCSILLIPEYIDLYKKILIAEYEARRDYQIPFHVLMTPLDMREVIKKFREDRYDFRSFHPLNAQPSLSIEDIFFRTVFGYCDVEYQEFPFEENEKEFLKLQFANNLEKDGRDTPLLTAIIKASNGHDLSKEDFLVLTAKIIAVTTGQMRKNSCLRRMNGILFYDFLLAVQAIDQTPKNNDFIKIFHNYLGLENKRIYNENTKDDFIEDRSLASKCINLGKIIATRNTGTTNFPKQKVVLPEFQFYKDYQNLFLELKPETAN